MSEIIRVGQLWSIGHVTDELYMVLEVNDEEYSVTITYLTARSRERWGAHVTSLSREFMLKNDRLVSDV